MTSEWSLWIRQFDIGNFSCNCDGATFSSTNTSLKWKLFNVAFMVSFQLAFHQIMSFPIAGKFQNLAKKLSSFFHCHFLALASFYHSQLREIRDEKEIFMSPRCAINQWKNRKLSYRENFNSENKRAKIKENFSESKKWKK